MWDIKGSFNGVLIGVLKDIMVAIIDRKSKYSHPFYFNAYLRTYLIVTFASLTHVSVIASSFLSTKYARMFTGLLLACL